MEKKCFKCGVQKPRDGFYAHPRMADGLLGKCKDCTKTDVANRISVKALDPEWRDKERTRSRIKSRGRKYRPMPGRTAIERARYPEKAKARAKCLRMKPTTQGNHLHHWSYRIADAKDLIELTMRDHHKAHRFLVYDPNELRYRRADTNELLNTKDAHETFIRAMIQAQPD